MTIVRHRVLIFSRSFLPTVGGLQYELKWFLDNLDRRTHGPNDIHAHFAYPEESCEPYSRFRQISAHNLGLDESKPLRTGKVLLRLSGLIRKIDPHIVHCHALIPEGTWALLASRLAGKSTKIVVSSHGNDIVSLPRWSYGGRKTIRSRFAARYTAPRIAAHVLPSQAMVDHAIKEGIQESKLIVIPNGVPIGDDYDFEDHSENHCSIPASDRLQLSRTDGINIMSLSSGRPIKNLETLVEAYAKARERLGRSKLILACQGPSSEAIRTLVDEKGLQNNVIFMGEVAGHTKHEYFRHSDVYCNVSHFESFGITLLEAMKHKTAVLASNVGGVPEFVKHERNGLLVSPTDVNGIAEALVRLYKDAELRKRLVAQAQEDVKLYSISRVIDEHLELYERVAS